MSQTNGTANPHGTNPVSPVSASKSPTRDPLRPESSHHKPIPGTVHHQFCKLVGIHPGKPKKSDPAYKPWSRTLYARVHSRYKNQKREHQLTAALSSTLLLLQIFIGAILTALGASNSPHIVIAVFGAINTVIAGVVTYLKGRGQPMRSKAYRDELERCIDEIEDTEAAFLGVTENMSGYGSSDGTASGNASDEGWEKTVRFEVERLTALYEAAQENARRNAPDLWVRAAEGQPSTTRTITGLTGMAKGGTGVTATGMLQGLRGPGDGGPGGENVTPATQVPAGPSSSH